MNLTRNTKIFKGKSESGTEVVYRTLNITELKAIDRMESTFHKNELAYKLAMISEDGEPNYFEIQQVGRDVLNNSMVLMNSEQLLDLTIDELRETIDNDPCLSIISNIMGSIPNVSFEYLLTLTYEDLIEMAVFCEKLTNKKIFDRKHAPTVETKGDANFFEDDGKSLQEKMKEQDSF